MEASSNQATHCWGCPEAGSFVGPIAQERVSLEATEGQRAKYTLRITDQDGMAAKACSARLQGELSNAETVGRVSGTVSEDIIRRIGQCTGPSTTTEGRVSCRAINDTVLEALVRNALQSLSEQARD